jgi:hypothetical protein
MVMARRRRDNRIGLEYSAHSRHPSLANLESPGTLGAFFTPANAASERRQLKGLGIALQPLLGAFCQLLVVLSNPKHHAPCLEVDQFVSDCTRLFGAFMPMLWIVDGD